MVGTVALEKGEKGTWKQTRMQLWSQCSNYTGYLPLEIQRQGKTVLVLDPYAKSLAAWNSDLAKTDASHKVAKAAAFVVQANWGRKT